MYFQDHKFQPASYRLLVVDDEPSVCSSLARVLRAEGYNVTTAADSSQAVQTILAQPTDLVLLDINLGDENGWQLCQRIRQINPAMPVIVVTANHDAAKQAAASGARAWFEKPLCLPDLLNQIQKELTANTTPSPHPHAPVPAT